MNHSLEVNDKKVKEAIERIVKLFNPKKIFLFGSYTKGTLSENSDLDLLILIDDGRKNTRSESIRIRRALKNIPMAMDIIVVTEKNLMS